jgi:hypothetical protein
MSQYYTCVCECHGSEFHGGSVLADNKRHAEELFQEQWPESTITQIETQQDAIDRQREVERRVMDDDYDFQMDW